jgi:MoaA/NifB/PqqE/SkfB family radical SAM enzyme
MTDPSPETGYLNLMDNVNRGNLQRSIRVILADFKRTIRILAARPSRIRAGIRILLHQKRALAIRRKLKDEGYDIPVMMLVSITSLCNLSCSGCYMQQRRPQAGPEMNLDELKSIAAQAEELGISVIGIIGGEPLLRHHEIIALAQSFPRIVFTLNTNGLLVNEETTEEIAGCENLVPFISLEGFRKETDSRRGQGMYDRVLSACSLMNDRVLFFGLAVTVSRNNIGEVLDESFIRTMIATGARAFIFIQYVPAGPGTQDLVPTPEQRQLVIRSMHAFNRNYPAFFIGIPGDMEEFGGCLAAGRGFIHVNPYGDLEPCPIVPISDGNLRTLPLKEALQSPLLRTIRENHQSLHANGRCILRTQPRWLEELLSKE